MSMPKFDSQEEREELNLALIALNGHVNVDVDLPVHGALGFRAPENEELLADIQALRNKLHELEASDLPLLKSAMIFYRRELALDAETKTAQTTSPEMRSIIEKRLNLVEDMTDGDWFDETEALPIPKLTDYLTIQRAEASLRAKGGLQTMERAFDEKFGILLAPGLFLPDLQRLRESCRLRNTSVSVAFIDIDDFKSFNTKYGEPEVDVRVLPAFMSALEAHVFGRGLAYRQGGDEYLVICPNLSAESSAVFFSEFQAKLRDVSFHEVEERIEVSVGICEVSPDCPLTEDEVRERAAFAKTHAKDQGKNIVAGFSGPRYRDDDVAILADATA